MPRLFPAFALAICILAAGCSSNPTCPGIDCGGTCTILTTDDANCGACGNACPAGQSCVQGACAVACAGGTTLCGAACLDLQADPAHCGTCDTACKAGEVCTAGKCALSCQAGLTACDGTCSDLTKDPEHCGDCATACENGQTCNGASECGYVCATGYTQCGNGCVDTDTDNANCGTCGNECADGTTCDGSGHCNTVCATGYTHCGNGCVDTDTDNANCGTCGNECTGGQMCNGEGDCAAPACNAAAVEVCNGLDDDCDGTTDEGTLCDDGLACTVDLCEGSGGCKHGLTGDFCVIDGACVESGTLDPTNACRACDPATSITGWSPVFDGTGCDADGNACTVGDECVSGTCLPGPTPDCSALTDTCNDGVCYGTGPDEYACARLPAHDGAACQDGDLCTKLDQCAAGVCQGTGYTCDDSLGCTKDSCDGAGGCANDLLAGFCLIAGDCASSGTINPDNVCQLCDPGRAPLAWSPKPDGSACTDGLGCTVGDQCVGGACAFVPTVCDDADDCTNDSCSEPDGTCAFAPKCDDQNPCTQNFCYSAGARCEYAPLGDTCAGTVVTLDDFESTSGALSNATGWTWSGTSRFDCPALNYGSGAELGAGYQSNYSMMMCNRNNANWGGWEHRDFSIATTHTTLSYWRDVEIGQMWPTTVNIELRDQSGNLLQTLETFTTNANEAWTQKSFDLGAITSTTNLRLQVSMYTGNGGHLLYQDRLRLDLIQLTSY